MIEQATKDLAPEDGVYVRYRLDGSLFNLRRLQAHTKTQERLIRDLLFAGDAALVAHTEQALQRITSCFAETSNLLGLEVSLKNTEDSGRRWSSIQAREFAHLHTALALLILNCDIRVYQTHECGEYGERKPVTVLPHLFLKMSPDMSRFVFGEESQRYVKEVVLAVRELAGGNLLSLFDMLVYCCYCNLNFSKMLLKQVMLQYTNVPASELKPIFSLLTELLTLEDPLQITRLQIVIDGIEEENGKKFEGLTTVIRQNQQSDSRRSYQCIKFLVALMNKSTVAKDFLLTTPSKWQGAVNWLKKKMTEHFWSSTTATVSNEDSNRKSFQRTQSAQYTLQEATALLTERENHEFNSIGSGSGAVGSTGTSTSGSTSNSSTGSGDTKPAAETKPASTAEGSSSSSTSGDVSTTATLSCPPQNTNTTGKDNLNKSMKVLF
ncbi:ubiquitin carboxyl-terminal hydrolase 24 [Elysia marginata]|uniref:Ubiquitin carboxyl-terminal hydrolase 24 n=1 Tax=Elysia marginata TaxID=1093978 RepID=A0AAV4FS50_9GAST|nr:ubiquitin carboxyl-terminal hydrolase 24 [Elysia marginata]